MCSRLARICLSWAAVGIAVLCVHAACGRPAQAGIVEVGASSLSAGDPEQSHREVVQKARAALERRDLAAAREALAPLGSLPDLPHPEILLAELLLGQGLVVDARNVLEQLGGKQPNRPDLYLAFARLAMREQRWFEGWTLARAGEASDAVELWNPEYARKVQDQLRLARAKCCEGRGDWTAARDIYKSLLDAGAKSPDILGGLGRASFHLGDVQAATEYFEKLQAADLNADSPQLLLAQLYVGASQPAEAEAAYQAALRDSDPDVAARARLELARWLITNNRPADARQALATQFDAQDSERERQYLLGLIARMEGRLADAQSVFGRLHRDDPSNLAISNQLALVLVQSDDESLRSRALQIAQANVRNQDKSAELWATLGWVQLRLGDRRAAEHSLAMATKLGPLTRDTLYYLREFKRTVGDTSSAEAVDKALAEATGPDFFTHLK